MEVYEMPITVEESRNYHKLLYQLKALNLVEWIKTYIFTVIFNMIFAFVIFTFSTNLALYIWNNVQKYFINNIPQEFLSGGIQLKKIKVSKNSLKVYYRRFHTQDFQ